MNHAALLPERASLPLVVCPYNLGTGEFRVGRGEA
jgi:hypothetical protein